MAPDLDTLRPMPVAAGHGDGAGRPALARRHATVVAVAAPDPARASSTGSPSAGWPRYAGTELEFIVFNDTYEEAWQRGLPRPRRRPTTTTSTTRCSAPRGSSRCCAGSATRWPAPGMTVESAKGECNLGQHEIDFRYAEALTHLPTTTSIYKTGAKEIAAQEGMSLTFMAKFNEREGNSCHIHLLAARRRRRRRSSPTTADDGGCRRRAASSPGSSPRMRELTLLLRAEHQLLQALRRRLLRADRGRLGRATTAPARCGSSATAPALRVENRVPGRRRQPVPRASPR